MKPLISSQIIQGDCLEVMRSLPERSVQCCVTSPPYFGLRDYGVDGQIGLEETPQDYVNRLVEVFREVWRVLRDDGTLWLNLGDSYSDNKNLVGIPWRVAFALQANGWMLRQDIIWQKTNAMPESVKDRCTKAHEYIFLLSKSEKYHYDCAAIAEPAGQQSASALSFERESKEALIPGQSAKQHRLGRGRKAGNKTHKHVTAYEQGDETARLKSGLLKAADIEYETRNKRSVWSVPTKGYTGAHFAVFPPALIEPCILAGCPEGGMVLDPFFGTGTTGAVALQHGRRYIGIELNPDSIVLANERIAATMPNFQTLEERVRWLETQASANGAKIRRIGEGQRQMNIFDCEKAR